MNEFWALVLGAGLATLGGIVSTLISNSINNYNTKKKLIENIYIEILNFCNQLIIIDYFAEDKNFIDKLIKIRVLVDMNANKKIYTQFNKIFKNLTANSTNEKSIKQSGKFNLNHEIKVLTDLVNNELKNNGSKRNRGDKNGN